MATDTTVNNLIINKLTKAQYEAIASPSETEIYLVPDEMDSAPIEGSTNSVESGGLYTAFAGKQDTISLTASRALISNASGKVAISSVTSTELGYLSGATSNIQTQLTGKQETLVSGTNIKTINNESLLGSGNISIQGGGGDTNVIETVKVNGTALTPDANKAVDVTVPTKTSDLTNDSHFMASTDITNVVYLTQAAYDALATKDSNTLYIIPES